MDRGQTGDFPVSLSSQIPAQYTQGNRQQHVNMLQGQDDMYNISHSRPHSRQHQDNPHESNRQGTSSTNHHGLHNKNGHSSFSSYPAETYASHIHLSQHDGSPSASKQQDITGERSQSSLEYSHRNSPIDMKHQSSGRGSTFTQSQSAHKQSYMNDPNTQGQQNQVGSIASDQQDFQKSNFSNKESQKQADLFYEQEIKKDSEIEFNNSDIQYLAKAENQSNLYARGVNNQSQVCNVTTSSPSDVVAVSEQSDIKNDKSQTGLSTQALHLPSDRTHVCLTCYKTFKNKPQLIQHELVHNGLRKHVCMYCDKAFKQICHLNQHTRVHTGERPYKCAMEGCGRAFAQLSNLNHHMKNHEDHVRREVSKQYRCEVCDRSYANQNSLHTHIQKLHMNLKAAEGSTANPIAINSPTKKRKKKNKQLSELLPDTGGPTTQDIVREVVQQYAMQFAHEGEDGLPTQVKTKPLKDLKYNSTEPAQTVDGGKNHTGQQKSSVSSIGQGQIHGLPYPVKFTDLQHFTSNVKTEHGSQMALDQSVHGADRRETQQLSQTYSPGHTPPVSTKPENTHERERSIQPPIQGDALRNKNMTTTNNGSPVTTGVPLPFLLHSSPNVAAQHFPSSLFTSPPTQSLQSVADSIPSQIRHHFPDVFVGSQLERDYRGMAAAQNFFNPAFTQQSTTKTEQNRYR